MNKIELASACKEWNNFLKQELCSSVVNWETVRGIQFRIKD